MVELARVRQEYQFLLVGYVVMPNHVHVLMSEPPKGTPSTVLQMLKQRVSRKMRKAELSLTKRPESPPAKTEGGGPAIALHVRELPQVWQPRFYDFNVYSHDKKNEKLVYMHANPVMRGLVENPNDWAWSSFSFYSTGEYGLISIDPINF